MNTDLKTVKAFFAMPSRAFTFSKSAFIVAQLREESGSASDSLRRMIQDAGLHGAARDLGEHPETVRRVCNHLGISTRPQRSPMRCMVSRATKSNRLKSGWNVREALTTPPLSRSEAARRGAEARWDRVAQGIIDHPTPLRKSPGSSHVTQPAGKKGTEFVRVSHVSREVTK